MTGHLSEHFHLSEFACHCGCGSMTVHPGLIDALEELRAKVGQPIRILSGRRCVEHNARVGGTSASRHVTGQAADIAAAIPLTSLALFAQSVPRFQRGGIGIYPGGGFVHVDIRPDSSRWAHVGGKYVGYRQGFRLAQAMERGEQVETT